MLAKSNRRRFREENDILSLERSNNLFVPVHLFPYCNSTIIKMLLLLLLFSVSLCAVLAIRSVWVHPLSKYPGPWLGKVSNALNYIAIVRGSRTFRQHAILQQYGSPARIGTNHLLFSDIESWTDIYGPSSNPCTKDPNVYAGFKLLDRDNLLSATDRGVHGRLRRIQAHAFSQRGLAASEGLIAEKVQRFVDITVAKSNGTPVDILPRIYQLYLDVVSHLSFGESFNCLHDKNMNAARDIKYYFSVVPLLAFVPFLRHVPLPSIREGLAGVDRLIRFSSRHVDEYLEKASALEGSSDGHLLHNLSQALDPESGYKLSRDDLVEHSVLFLAAGSGTTSGTLTFLLWECGRNEPIRIQLAQEIRAMFPDANVMPDFERASKLVGLRAVLPELLSLTGNRNICLKLSAKP